MCDKCTCKDKDSYIKVLKQQITTQEKMIANLKNRLHLLGGTDDLLASMRYKNIALEKTETVIDLLTS